MKQLSNELESRFLVITLFAIVLGIALIWQFEVHRGIQRKQADIMQGSINLMDAAKKSGPIPRK